MVELSIDNIESELNKIKGISKVLVLSDLHIPFHKEETILKIIKDNPHVDKIIFAGDIIDCFSVSSFPKDLRIPFYEELKEASSFLKKVDRLTPNVKKIVFRGNHEYRYKRYLAKYYNEITTLLTDDVLEIIKNGFSYRDARNIKRKVEPLSDNYEVIDNWYYLYNDVVFAHPSSYSKIPMRTCLSAYDYFKNKGFEFKAICIGHTHKLGNVIYGTTLLSELGCLCKSMEYANNGNVGQTIQSNGYGLYTFKDNKVDIYNSGSVFYSLGDDAIG